jgi:hypothetical protein
MSCDGDAISFKRVFQAVLAELFCTSSGERPKRMGARDSSFTAAHGVFAGII